MGKLKKVLKYGQVKKTFVKDHMCFIRLITENCDMQNLFYTFNDRKLM